MAASEQDNGAFRQAYYAHTKPACLEDQWEPVEKHLRDVSARAGEFAAAFGAAEWGQLAGLWHDLGKYSSAFQEYLHKSAIGSANSRALKGPDHSTAGAQHSELRCQGGPGRIIAYCIAGHHAGLADATDESGGLSGLDARLLKVIESFARAPRGFLDATCPTLPGLDWGSTHAQRSFRLSTFCRMLFSCLVDADFLATENFGNPERATLRRGETLPLDGLLDSLNVRLAQFAANNPLNEKRREVLAACREKAELSPGLFSLTVPTGGGKTLSSLAFALTHAVRYGQRRVIYAIPFTSIIEQNAKVFRDAVETNHQNVVLEHHSNFERKKGTDDAGEGGERYWDWLTAENWDAPLVVTTNVQLFESLFANKPSRCRKLHNIVNSVIILDEVQTLPVQLLRPTLAMLEELYRNYGCTVVLCSATQPAIRVRDDFSIGLRGVREIIDDVPSLFSALKRVSVEQIGKLEDADLATRLLAHEQVLAIVNLRDHAADLFNLLKDEGGESLFHLSANMCAAHRTDMLKRIRQRLNPLDPKPCTVISTQLVEAGVDIDFPVVYRAMCGVDSIAQAAGRCNREGKLATGQVYLFETDRKPPAEINHSAEETREVTLDNDDLLSLAAIEQYFRLHYWRRKEEWDKYDIMDCFKQGLHLQFRTAASEYKLIRDEQEAVIVPYSDTGRRLIDEIQSLPEARDYQVADWMKRVRGITREAQRYSVGVYPRQLDALRKAMLVTLYHETFWVLEDPGTYDIDLGLRRDIHARDPEGLIV